jgi:hypothetical protein
MSTRSRVVKKGCFDALSATPTITWSKSFARAPHEILVAAGEGIERTGIDDGEHGGCRTRRRGSARVATCLRTERPSARSEKMIMHLSALSRRQRDEPGGGDASRLSA